MSQQFFSLIKNESVHLAPQTKVVKADNFAKLLDSEQILEAVKADAEQYRLSVTAECEKLKEQAQKEGFAEGFKQWVEQIAKQEEEIIKVREDVEKTIIPIALKAAKKIVGREIELSESVIVDIVASNLKVISQHKKILIYVNRRDLDVLEKNKNQLKDLFENLETLSIRERTDIEPGGCVIETEGGIINAQLDNQWRILEQAFANLMKKK